MESSTVSSQFISVRGGQLTFNDAVIPDNQVAVVIIDYILENVYYEGAFNPDVPQSPVCFAYGRDDKDMAPHDDSPEKQNPVCEGCPQNAWGTADRGRGKACRNSRRLAMIAIGNFEKNGDVTTIYDEQDDEAMAEHIQKTTIALLKVPVTSVKGFSAYVKNLAGTFRRPPFGVLTRLYVTPDPKTQFRVNFEPLSLMPDDAIPMIVARRAEALNLLTQPYPPIEVEVAPPPPRRGAAAPGRAPAANPGRGGRKY